MTMTQDQKDRLLGVNRNWAELLNDDEYAASFHWAFDEGWQDAADMESAYRAGYDNPTDWENEKIEHERERFDFEMSYHHLVMPLTR